MASSPAGHKPRKKRRSNDYDVFPPRDRQPKPDSLSTALQPAFPLVSFLWHARGGVSQWVVLPLILMVAGLFRWTTGFWGYSGFESPPMHGDFEAQRHWMEIAAHLPMSQWYFHDLEWWGLDYPPLTAYHSWFLGKIGSVFNNTWFALHSSRGLDDPALKVYMRATVFISEYLIYIPSVVVFCRRLALLERNSTWSASVAIFAILMQPATILIDHAHFQYNTVMLGLFVAALSNMLANKTYWSCVFFVAALGFKQMALYYAPAIFAYLVAICIFPRLDIPRFVGISIVTSVSFFLLFAPLLLGAIWDTYRLPPSSLTPPPLLQSLNLNPNALYYPILLQLTQAIHRIFPLARGVFEDKVASFWCALHTFYKLHNIPTSLIQRLSLAATAVSILPGCTAIFLQPRRTLLLLALASTAWGFFLFSFHVHEKTVLLPLFPMTLLLASDGGLQPPIRAWVTWANILGSWTLFPLLKRDELRVPYVVLTLLWAWLMGVPEMLALPVYTDKQNRAADVATRLVQGIFYLAMIVWHVLEAWYPPPPGKQDLWTVVNVLIGFAGFGLCYLWCTLKLLRVVFVREKSLREGSSDKTKLKKTQ